ncbi:helix-turn-helix transcriptional regulator [Marinactinospora thermotolerans]|uniref:helix-turn-helix transcriptional regulator n=1 Tax=Marinactinospora thermotolerans TaxID=531310 RepID=UPI003D8C2FCD
MTDDLMSTQDIADRLGVKVSTVRQYKLRGDLPAPLRTIGRSPVWRRETIEAWIASRPGQGWRRDRPRDAATD